MLKAPCEALVCSKDSVSASSAQHANRSPLSSPRDLISALTKERGCKQSCAASEKDPTLPVSLQSSSIFPNFEALSQMQTKSSSSDSASEGSHSAQPDDQRLLRANMTLNGLVTDDCCASSGERHEALHHSRSIFLVREDKELGGQDGYVQLCFCGHESNTSLPFTIVE